MNATLLIVDDDEAIRRLVTTIFVAAGLKVIEASDGESALALAVALHPDVALVDAHMPGMNGFDLLERLKADVPGMPAIMLTGDSDVKSAVRAMQLGAVHYLTKPMNREELQLVVQRALEAGALREELQELRRHLGRRASDDLAAQMGPGEQISAVIAQVRTVAASNFTVLIQGETGTGKEIVAQAVHKLSARRRRPFVALDCGAIPEALLESELFGHEKGAFTGADRRQPGRFRLAEGGTCFLDEMGNLPPSLQAKLLRVLESGELQSVGAERSTPMNVRFIAATNQDLEARVSQGVFRSDLYFRLAQYAIRLPALRERQEDIEYLARRFMDEAGVELRRPVLTIDEGALDLLRRHSWPGNVRELRNVVRQAVLQTTGAALHASAVELALGDRSIVRQPGAAPAPSMLSLREIAAQAASAAERDAIRGALQLSGGNKSQAARALRTDYKTLHLKMKQMAIRAADFTK